MKGYEPRDIYNMDETGLFYRTLPDRTLSIKGDECKGGKKSKDRITVSLCVNMVGDFEKPLVIGRAAVPRCMKNVKHLPVTWRYNRKAWMTTELFKEWITDFNKKMRKARRQVVLLLDNAPSHPKDLNLSNVKLVFLPANTTSRLQPLDQGIIQAIKQLYRKKLLRSVISKIDDNEQSSASSLSKSVNVLDAILWVSSAMNEVSGQTVQKCFLRCGFAATPEEESDDDDIPIAELVKLMKNAQKKITTCSEMTPEEFLKIDEDIPTC